MRITSLRLRSYRNYEELHLDFDAGVQIFLGANAQGKTNIIEALYYAAFGRSHRTSSDAELIRMGEDGAHIGLSFLRHDVPSELSFTFAHGARRRIERSGENLRQRDLVGILPMVLFSPEDLFLVKHCGDAIWMRSSRRQVPPTTGNSCAIRTSCAREMPC